MGKNKKKRSRGSNGFMGFAAASATTAKAAPADDVATIPAGAAATAEQQKRRRQEQRRAVLTHETKEKRDTMKLKLHITRVQRELDSLRSRLEAWDPVEEEDRRKKEEERQRAEAEAAAATEPPKKKRYRRPGPETWKLKGAARPAWEVYDFDTRYVDPYIKAHEDAAAKAKRSVNVLAMYKQGKLDQALHAEEFVRDYLALLMQLGYLNEHARKYKSARQAWRECVELEGLNHPITPARESLMRMYMKLEKYNDAFSLGESLVASDATVSQESDSESSLSVWIRYSMALAAHLKEHDKTLDYMRDAVRANPLCAYYLAFFDIVDPAIEYKQEIVDRDDEDDEIEPESSLEEAIEYCYTSGRKWQESGAGACIRDMLLQAVKGQDKVLTRHEVDWNHRLKALDEEVARRQLAQKDDSASDDDQQEEEGTDSDSSQNSSDNQDADADEGPPDLAMYIGMFRTAMEMVEEEGFVVS